MNSSGMLIAANTFDKASAKPKNKAANIVGTGANRPIAAAANAIKPRPATMPFVKVLMYAIERNTPPNDAKNPLISNAITLVLRMGIPTDSAASGFSPTQRMCIPSFVLYSKNQTANTVKNAMYVNTFCPDRMLPNTGTPAKLRRMYCLYRESAHT